MSDINAWTITGKSPSGAAILQTGEDTGTAYNTLQNAITNAAVGTAASPQMIILLKELQVKDLKDMSKGDASAYSIDGKHIRLVAEQSAARSITGASSGSDKSIFEVKSGSSFTLCGDGSGVITLDGNGTGHGVYVEKVGTIIMNGGKIIKGINTAGQAAGY
jgi:hypothetical protein